MIVVSILMCDDVQFVPSALIACIVVRLGYAESTLSIDLF